MMAEDVSHVEPADVTIGSVVMQPEGPGAHPRVGLVVIGRNEGDRLKASLLSAKAHYPDLALVYVDSGSTDDSVEFAKSIGARVVELDTSHAFTAARARNAGFNALFDSQPGNSSADYVQFLDGDCILSPDWLKRAIRALDGDSKLAITSGRRVELHPERSIYNRLMDIEWSAPPGDVAAVLGDMCIKTHVFREVGGFAEDLIAAEDDDLCIRTRALGYKILRLADAMSLHDANILTLSQWYRRQVRGGYGYAAIYAKHRSGISGYFGRQLASVLMWAVGFPATCAVALVVDPRLSVAVALAAGLLIGRTMLRRLSAGSSAWEAAIYTFLMYSGKFAELLGVYSYVRRGLVDQPIQLIEYK